MLRYFLILAAITGSARAHDTWIQVNAAKSEARQPVYADLMLGNHGNNHRDYLLASKIPLKNSTLVLLPPGSGTVDLIPALIDLGSTEKEGYWSARILPSSSGLHAVAHTYDAVVTYAPKRVIKSAKTYFISGAPGADDPSFTEPLGHPLEIVPLSNPATLTAGDSLQVKVLFKGNPLEEAVVSCIPRGKELETGFDPAHEAKTDAKGLAVLSLPEPNHYLIVVHQKAPQETGETHSAGTDYGATLTLWVGVK